jgi:hypothetical protein
MNMQLFKGNRNSIISLYHLMIMGCSVWSIVFLTKMIRLHNSIQAEYTNNADGLKLDGRVIAHVQPEVIFVMQMMMVVLVIVILILAITWKQALVDSLRVKYVLILIMFCSIAYALFIGFGIHHFEGRYFWKSNYTKMYLLTLVPFLVSTFLLPFSFRTSRDSTENFTTEQLNSINTI